MSFSWDGPHVPPPSRYALTPLEIQTDNREKKFKKLIDEFNAAKPVDKAYCLLAVLEAKINVHKYILRLDLPNKKHNEYHTDELKLATDALLNLITSEDATSDNNTIPEQIDYPYNLS